jgi:hypothetical protein
MAQSYLGAGLSMGLRRYAACLRVDLERPNLGMPSVLRPLHFWRYKSLLKRFGCASAVPTTPEKSEWRRRGFSDIHSPETLGVLGNDDQGSGQVVGHSEVILRSLTTISNGSRLVGSDLRACRQFWKDDGPLGD